LDCALSFSEGDGGEVVRFLSRLFVWLPHQHFKGARLRVRRGTADNFRAQTLEFSAGDEAREREGTVKFTVVRTVIGSGASFAIGRGQGL
jgi:hypothetical protein